MGLGFNIEQFLCWSGKLNMFYYYCNMFNSEYLSFLALQML